MSVLLSFLLVVSGFTFVPEATAKAHHSAGFVPSRDCKDGSCVDRLTGLFEAKLRDAHQNHCLPPQGQNVRQWAQNHSISQSCLRKIAELEELKHKLEAVSQYLSNIQDCVNCSAHSGGSQTPDLARALSHPGPQCTESRKRQIVNQCDDDALCVFVSGGVTSFLPQAVRNRMIPESLRRHGCTGGAQDSCLAQFATGFAKAVFSLFEGAWDLLKSAGKAAWHWLTGAESHSSTAQLAAAHASGNDGVFRQLLHDFPGTMGRIWQALLSTIKHWLSYNVFCEHWSGTPQFSTCTKPAQGFGCTSCKAMITGMCSLTGTIMSEVVPAFLTGGLSVAAKYGAEGALRLARLIRVPASTLRAVRASRVSRFVVRTGEAAATALRTSRVTTAAIAASRAAIHAIAPSIRALGNTLTELRSVIRETGSYIMSTKAGPVLIVGTKLAKGTGHVLLLPIDNSLFRASFTLGGRTMEGMMRAGGNAIRVARGGVIAARAGGAVDPVESAFVKMEMHPTGTNQRAYVDAVRASRGTKVTEALRSQPDITFSHLLEEYYPDLDYGKYSSLLSADKIETAERDLFNALSSLPEGAEKTRLLRDYQNHLSSSARASLSGVKTFTRENVLANAALPDETKIDRAIEVAGVNSQTTSPENLQRIKEGIRRAESVPTSGALHETTTEIQAQVRALTDSGLSEVQAHRIVRSGAVSTPRPEDLFPTLRAVSVPEVTPEAVTRMSQSEGYITVFSGVEEARRPAVARALKILEQDGSSVEEVASTYRKFEPHFKRVQSGATRTSDPESLLAEYIRKSRKAGKTDADIERELSDAFRSCR